MSVTQRKTKEEVVENLHDVAREMYKRMAKGEAPTMTLPVRTKTTSDSITNLVCTSMEVSDLFVTLPA